nr:hypothetical protein [uncultured Campylobacter sp.]
MRFQILKFCARYEILNPYAWWNFKISPRGRHFKIRRRARKIVEFYVAGRRIIQNGAYTRLWNFKFDVKGRLANATKFIEHTEWF